MLSSVLAVVMVMSSCNKEVETVTDQGKTPQQSSQGFVPKAGGTPGEIHNQMALDYMNQYGLPSDHQLTPTDVNQILNRIGTIAQNRGVMAPGGKITDMADGFTQKLGSLGYFNGGTLRNPDQLNQMAIQGITNPGVKNAFGQIYSLAKADDPAFLAKSKEILDAVTNVTPQEKARLDGARSVLEHSYEMWSQKRPSGGCCVAVVAFTDFSYYYYHSITVIETPDFIYVIEETFISVTFSLFVGIMMW